MLIYKIEGNTASGSYLCLIKNNINEARSICYDLGMNPFTSIKEVKLTEYRENK